MEAGVVQVRERLALMLAHLTDAREPRSCFDVHAAGLPSASAR
jgi:hypothetical protein